MKLLLLVRIIRKKKTASIGGQINSSQTRPVVIPTNLVALISCVKITCDNIKSGI